MLPMRKTQYGGVKFQSVDEYHAAFAPEVRALLDQLRGVVRAVAPEATEKISYNIPTFSIGKALVHYGAYPTHIGFYPTPSAILEFQEELSPYKTSKGTVQFPLDKPLPLALIEEIVRFRKKMVCPD
jgi:uncharacterized protein YdhG (YjbR/CyaY superfamily)